MARIVPSLRATETYTETNFLFLHTLSGDSSQRKVTLEHFFTGPRGGDGSGWSCQTIVDAEIMSRDDAVFIAENYARENDIPVIYESHTDPS